MAGLMTSLLLQSVGLKNWEIIESSQRVGGYVFSNFNHQNVVTHLNPSRIRTKYLNGTTPDQYQYQEMGPMRCKKFECSVNHHVDRSPSSRKCNIC
jgi:hypothetical protein